MRPRHVLLTAMLAVSASAGASDPKPPEGFVALFNGRDLTGWKADDEAKRHWVARVGVLSYDAKHADLWTDRSFGDFVLGLEWRWAGEAKEVDHPVIGPDGQEVQGPDGRVKTERMLDAGDSGIFLRGSGKSQVNLFCYPVGSGEVWGYRTDPAMTPEVRRAVTPRKRADRPPGEWNAIVVTMKGDRLTVVLNGEEVISDALLPGVPAEGPIALQHEFGAIEFRNIFLKELPSAKAPSLRVPEGFVVERAAPEGAVAFPMFAAFDDRGRLFVAESSGLDLYAELTAQTRKCRVRLLEDRDGDGSFETTRVFAEGLVFPMGLAWGEGRLYVADPPELIALDDLDGDGRADRRTAILREFGHIDNGSLHGLVFGPDGLLYMTMGSPDHYEIRRADGTTLRGRTGALIRCRPDGGEPEVLARGFANLVEVAFNPRGDLFGTVNWYQLPGDGFRDALVHLVADGRFSAERDDPPPLVTGPPLPPMALHPAVAHSGLVLYGGASFPEEMAGNLFTAQHNTRKVGRHELVPEGSTYRTVDHDFVTTDDPNFHPSDVVESPDGSLLVVDTGSWYVQHCPTGLIRNEHAPGGLYRVRSATPRPARARTGVEARQDAIWASARPGADLASARAALADPDPSIAIPAARAVGLRRDRDSAPALRKMLRAGDTAIRSAACEALARCGDASCVPDLWKLLATDADRFAEHAVVAAVHHLADADSLEAALTHTHPRVRAAAVALMDQAPRLPGRLSAEAVLARVRDDDPRPREAALRVLEGHPEWADRAIDLLRGWLSSPTLGEDERRGLSSLFVAYAGRPETQALMARAVLDREGETPTNRRSIILEAMADAPPAETPPSWREALAAAVARPDAAEKVAAIRAVAALRLGELDDRLAALADSGDESREVRLEALRAIAPRRPEPSVDSFRFLLGLVRDDEPIGRLAASELLGRSRLGDDSLREYLRALDGQSLIAPASVAPLLARSATDATAPEVLAYLTGAIASGWRPSEAEIKAMLAPLPEAVRAREASLLAERNRLVGSPAALLERYEVLLEGGDADRGRAVFFGKKVACGGCHRVGPDGGEVGPDLTKVGAIRSGRDLLESIVVPSSTLAQGYDPYLVATTDGRTHSGILAKRTADSITLRDASGADLTLRRDAVEALTRQTTSLMPEGLDRAITADEFRDLIAFLRGRK